jgi:predicted DCC family thiol-disulfide oxidoreductase YuxK
VPTLLYDEGCRFCTALSTRLARLGRGLEAVPIGSPQGDRLLADLAPAERYATVHLVDEAGGRHSGGAALPPLLARLPGGRLPARLAAALPGPTALGYRLVARHRGTLSRLTRSGGQNSS